MRDQPEDDFTQIRQAGLHNQFHRPPMMSVLVEQGEYPTRFALICSVS